MTETSTRTQAPTPPVPQSFPPAAGRRHARSRGARAAAALLAAGALAATTLTTGPLAAPPAGADEQVITTQDYVAFMGLERTHAKGRTGKGVTIALIEEAVDTSVPELAGADITVKPLCSFPADPKSTAHATATASILVAPAYGWAPEASLISYAIPTTTDADGDGKPDEHPDCTNTHVGDATTQALNDDVDVISISLGGLFINLGTEYPLARAAKEGVPVVVGTGNDQSDSEVDSLADQNVTIGVGATDNQGTIAPFSNYGAGTTVVAPGTDITMREPDETGALTRVTTGNKGTSYSTPMVAGLLALAKQKWPQADGNQLTASLMATADLEQDGWDQYYGWGLINPKGILNTDPTTYPSTSPLLTKFPDSTSIAGPTAQQRTDYDDGVADPSLFKGDNSYTYRGLDETTMRNDPEHTQLGTSPRYDTTH